MRKRSICKVEGCEAPHVPGAYLCQAHLGEKRRCTGIVKVRDVETKEPTGEERRCRKSARNGNTVCTSHGAGGKAASAVATRVPALKAMERFVTPYAGNLDPITAFEMEFRRTYGRILWLEEQIGSLEDEKDLIWGKTREEDVRAAEFGGTNTTYEAKIHVFEEMLRWERVHYHNLMKTWIRANLDERKLSLMREYVEGTYSSVVTLLRSLGHDTADPGVRDKMRRMFESGAEAPSEVGDGS